MKLCMSSVFVSKQSHAHCFRFFCDVMFESVLRCVFKGFGCRIMAINSSAIDYNVIIISPMTNLR